MGKYLEYRGFRTLNREVFLLKDSRAVSTFDNIHQYFETMVHLLRGARTSDGKSRIASLGPMILLMQRQFCNAFDCISSFQAYEAWLILRPSVEIPLIIGKWLDDRNNVEIWKARATNKKAYRQCYMGEALRSKSLSDSERIQGALSHLNDLFVHPYPEYCHRHYNLSALDSNNFLMRVEYFDEENDVMVSWLAMSHLMVFLQDRLWGSIATTMVDVPTHPERLQKFENEFGTGAEAAADKSSNTRELLEKIGLWIFNSSV